MRIALGQVDCVLGDIDANVERTAEVIAAAQAEDADLVAEAPLDDEALVVVDVDLAGVRRRRREVPLVKEARLGMVLREVQRLVDEGGDL